MSRPEKRRLKRVPGCRIPRRIEVESLERRALLATFVVTNDLDDGSAGSLRDAILASNAAASTPTSPNTIDFNIPGAGVRIIFIEAAMGALPAPTQPVIIDGTSEPAWPGSPLIQIDGSNFGSAADGLDLTGSSNNIVEGLSLVHFAAGAGIRVSTSNNQLLANFLGLAADGRRGPRVGMASWSPRPATRSAGPRPVPAT